MNTDTFVNTENWHGSYYELCMELGSAGDDTLLTRALTALWSWSALAGPWRLREEYGSSPAPISSDDLLSMRFGVAHLDGVELGCVTHVVREEAGSDWLDLCFPTGMLELAYEVQYPLYDATNAWTARLDGFLTEIAVHVYQQAGFRLGVIGEETSGAVYAASLISDEYERYRLVLPLQLAAGIGATNSRPLAAGLCVLPPRGG